MTVFFAADHKHFEAAALLREVVPPAVWRPGEALVVRGWGKGVVALSEDPTKKVDAVNIIVFKIFPPVDNDGFCQSV